jgi:hypothetical protein
LPARSARNACPLAEELALTTAELSYLAERRQAYENLGNRTGLEAVKSITTALIQAERYGTPLGQALRVLSQESRDIRMNEAEKKAGGAAAEADRADDPVLPAGAVRGHHDAGADPGLRLEVSLGPRDRQRWPRRRGKYGRGWSSSCLRRIEPGASSVA